MRPGTTTGGDDPRPESGSTELDLEGRMVLEEDQSLSLRLRLRYDVGAPFAITLQLLGESRPLATWQLSREVLAEGLHKPSGLGDIRIWPPCRCHDTRLLRIMLRGSEGPVLVDMPVEPVSDWLRSECFALVPAGAEGDLIDWEAELARLTGGEN